MTTPVRLDSQTLGGVLPFVVREGERAVLAEDVRLTGVSASHVIRVMSRSMLDLNGHAISVEFDPSATASGATTTVVIGESVEDAVVRNGKITTNGPRGLRISGCARTTVERLEVDGFGGTEGVLVEGPIVGLSLRDLTLRCGGLFEHTAVSRQCLARGWVPSDRAVEPGFPVNPTDSGACPAGSALRVTGKGPKGVHGHNISVTGLTIARFGARAREEHAIVFDGSPVRFDGVPATCQPVNDTAAASNRPSEHDSSDGNRGARILGRPSSRGPVVGFSLDEFGSTVLGRASAAIANQEDDAGPMTFQEFQVAHGVGRAFIDINPAPRQRTLAPVSIEHCSDVRVRGAAFDSFGADAEDWDRRLVHVADCRGIELTGITKRNDAMGVMVMVADDQTSGAVRR